MQPQVLTSCRPGGARTVKISDSRACKAVSVFVVCPFRLSVSRAAIASLDLPNLKTLPAVVQVHLNLCPTASEIF